MIGIIDSQSFSPNKVSGLVIWLDGADLGSIVDSGSPDFKVSQWNDKSQTGNDAVQVLIPNQPKTNLTTMSQLNTVSFDDGINLLEIFSDSSFEQIWVGGGTFIFVSQSNSFTGNDQGRFLDKNQSWTFSKRGGGFEALRFISHFSVTDGNFITQDGTVAAPSNPSIITLTYNSDNVSNVPIFYLDGSIIPQDPPVTPVGSHITNTSILGVGNSVGAPNNLSMSGDMGEVLFYDRILSDSERGQVEEYLLRKWEISTTSFSPIQIPGLQIWLDAFDTTTINAPGNKVFTWEDKSGNSVDFIQTTGTNQPETELNTINGRNVIHFDGVDDVMVANSSATLRVIFIVARIESGFPNFSGLFNEAGEDFRNIRMNGATLDFRGNANTNASDFTDGELFGTRINSVVSTAIQVGTPFIISAIASSGFTFISQISQDINSRFWKGDIAEVIAYDFALDAINRSEVEQYLSNKWGIPLV